MKKVAGVPTGGDVEREECRGKATALEIPEKKMEDEQSITHAIEPPQTQIHRVVVKDETSGKGKREKTEVRQWRRSVLEMARSFMPKGKQSFKQQTAKFPVSKETMQVLGMN